MLSLLLALATTQTNAVPPPTCTVEIVPPELAGWIDRAPLKATANSAALAAAMLPPGKAVAVVLSPLSGVNFALTPAHAPAEGGFAGLLRVAIAQAGRYRIALGSAAWIDLIRDGAALTPVAFGHGPTCSTIRKQVDFDLTPGTYTLQLSGSTTPAFNAMVARLP